MNRNPVLIANQNETITTMAVMIEDPPEESKIIQMGTPVWSNTKDGKDLFVLPASESLRKGVYLNGVLASDVRFNEGDTMLTAVAVVTGGVVSVRVEKGLETLEWNPYLIINDARLGECRLVLNHAVREKAVGGGGVDEGEKEIVPVLVESTPVPGIESEPEPEPEPAPKTVAEPESKSEPAPEGVPPPNLAAQFLEQTQNILNKDPSYEGFNPYSAAAWQDEVNEAATSVKRLFEGDEFKSLDETIKAEFIRNLAKEKDSDGKSIFYRIPKAVIYFLGHDYENKNYKYVVGHLLERFYNFVFHSGLQVAEIPEGVKDVLDNIDNKVPFQQVNMLKAGTDNHKAYTILLRDYFLQGEKTTPEAWDAMIEGRRSLQYNTKTEASFAAKPPKKKKQRKKESSKLKVAL
jgi:hypothetical protein